MSFELFKFEFRVVGIEMLGFCILGMNTAICCFCDTAVCRGFCDRSRERPWYAVFVIPRYSMDLACGHERDRCIENLVYRSPWQIIGIFILLIAVLADFSG